MNNAVKLFLFLVFRNKKFYFSIAPNCCNTLDGYTCVNDCYAYDSDYFIIKK